MVLSPFTSVCALVQAVEAAVCHVRHGLCRLTGESFQESRLFAIVSLACLIFNLKFFLLLKAGLTKYWLVNSLCCPGRCISAEPNWRCPISREDFLGVLSTYLAGIAGACLVSTPERPAVQYSSGNKTIDISMWPMSAHKQNLRRGIRWQHPYHVAST